MALLPPGGSRRRWAPATVQTNCVLRGSLPGLARGRRRLPHTPPRAEAALQSWPLGSALPPSPRRRLRLRRARHRLTLPPQLWLGTGRSGSPEPSPGSGGRRARRAAARPKLWGGRGGRCSSRKGGRLARASEEAPRLRSRGCPPGSRCVLPRAPARARRRAEPPVSILRPAGGFVPRRLQQQSGTPSPEDVPITPQPARTWARGVARRAPGPAKFASWLGAEPRARPGPAPLGGTESPQIGRQGCGADRGGSAPSDAACKVREKKTSAPGRFGPRCKPRPPKPAPLKESPHRRLPPRSDTARPPGPGAWNRCDCVLPDDPTRGRGGGGGRATWPLEEVS